MDKDILMVLIQILISLHLIMDTFPDLFGLQPQPATVHSTLTPHMLMDIDEDNELLDPAVRMFQSSLTDFVVMTSYKPRALIGSGMWVKHRSRGWFNDFMLQYDDERWLEIMKMSSGTFNWLCNILAPHIQMQVTNYRIPLPVPMRLGAVLYKLLWAATDIEMSEGFGIGQSTMYCLLRQVVPVINRVLGYHVQWQGGDTLRHSMLENEKRSGIPNIVGAIDCTQIRINAPKGNAKFDYFNRKGYYSIAMQAVVDPYTKFLDIFVGQPGSMNDGRVLRLSPLYEPACFGTLRRGEDVILANGSRIPPILVGDAIYPSLPWLVCSYKRLPGQPILSHAKCHFNKKLSKSRIYSEIAFGRLKGTFKEVGWKSNLDIDFLPEVVKCCCILYNILVDFKEVDFDSIFNEMDAFTAILADDQIAYAQEPIDANRIHRSTGTTLREVLCEHVNNM